MDTTNEVAIKDRTLFRNQVKVFRKGLRVVYSCKTIKQAQTARKWINTGHKNKFLAKAHYLGLHAILNTPFMQLI